MKKEKGTFLMAKFVIIIPQIRPRWIQASQYKAPGQVSEKGMDLQENTRVISERAITSDNKTTNRKPTPYSLPGFAEYNVIITQSALVGERGSSLWWKAGPHYVRGSLAVGGFSYHLCCHKACRQTNALRLVPLKPAQTCQVSPMVFSLLLLLGKKAHLGIK